MMEREFLLYYSEFDYGRKTNFQIKKGFLVNLRGRKSTLSGPHVLVPTFPLSTPPPPENTPCALQHPGTGLLALYIFCGIFGKVFQFKISIPNGSVTKHFCIELYYMLFSFVDNRGHAVCRAISFGLQCSRNKAEISRLPHQRNCRSLLNVCCCVA